MTQIQLPKLRKVDPNKPKKKKILLLSDDLRMHSGIATMSREIVLQTCKEFDWVQLAAAVQHPEQGKVLDLSQDTAVQTGVDDAYLKLYPFSGYGTPEVLREIINIEKPDAVLHFTDPRFWGWLYGMEHELRQLMPLFYYTIWDDVPYPRWNKPFYESCDLLMCISKQTYNIVKQVLKNTKHEDWQITYVPHGINQNNFYPIDETHPEWNELQNFRKELVGDEIDFITFYNARNIRRKHTSDLILGFKEFCDTLPKEKADKCLLLMHTEQIDDNGTDLPAVINELCPYKVKFTSNRIITTKELNYLYNISDVTANIASNEGFGLGTAESVMAGTPIVVNVTGGMQDQCGFKDDSGKYLTEYDYNDDFQTNAVKRYTSHGEWAEPVFPAVRTLQGSPPTPYIFDDIADFRDCAVAIKTWYDRDYAERKRRGKVGREWMLSKETGLSAESMGERFVKDMNTAFTNWSPRVKVELIKI